MQGRYLAAIFLLLAFLVSNVARATPAECRPLGANSCVNRLPDPYSFRGLGCNVIGLPKASESAAFEEARAGDYGNRCNLISTPQGWGNPTPKPNCGGGSSYPPETAGGGIEVLSYQNYLLDYNDTNPSGGCSPPGAHQVVTKKMVKRERALRCPAGYTQLGTYCRVIPTVVDPARNLGCGDSCLLQGNPVNVATGNKYERRVDYQGAGAFPLRFERHYNSAMRRLEREASYFMSQQYDDKFGNEFVNSGADPSNGTYRNLGVGVMGVNWRHSYQRALDFLDNEAGGGLAGFYAYRPDGNVIAFVRHAGVYVAPADVTDRLIDAPTGSGAVYRFIGKDDETEDYDASGRLIRITSRSGLTQTMSYDVCSRLTAVADDFGHALTFEYDGVVPSTEADCRLVDWRLRRMIDPAGEIYEYTQTGRLLTGVAHPDGTTLAYTYGSAGSIFALTSITDEAGNLFASYTYDASNRVTVSEHAGGAGRITLSYPSTSRTVVTDALGTARNFNRQMRSHVWRSTGISASCVGCGEQWKTITNDANGNATSRIDFNDIDTRYSYDLTRNLETSRTEAFGTPRARTITTTWHAGFRLPTLITEPNRSTSFTHDTSGNVLTKTVTDTATSQSRTWTSTYNAYGQLLTEDGPRTDVTDVTTYTYHTCTTGNECGQVHTVTNALSQTTTFNTYNAHGLPLTITDPNGLVTTLAYDLRQRLTFRTVGTETTSFEYWPTGLLKKVTLPDTSFTLYTYDNAHRLTEIEDGEGNRIEYTLDLMGNRTAENVYDPSSALARTRTQVFNTLNQLWKQLGAAGTTAVTTTLGYDANGNQTSANAPLARNTGQLYDELNRLKQITDPGSGITQFAYDGNDNLTSVTDPKGLNTGYTYNGFGDLTQQVSSDTGTTVNTYDAGGNLSTSTDARGKVGTYTYDALNRVTSIAHPDRTITYAYDAGTNGVGRLTGASDSSHSLAWSHDAQGRVIGKAQTIGSLIRSVGYGYTDGNLTSLVTPSGQTITYGYANGKVSSITLNGSTTILNDVLYEPFGPVSGWTWGNSTLAVRVYDLDGKPSDIDSAGAYTYAYDDAFRITGITDLTDSTKTWSYGYDLLDRLNAASRTTETIGYTYDANGNRLTQSGTTAASYTVSGTSNRVTSITGTPARTYGYDPSGNTTGYGSLSFTYSDAGRMTAVTNGPVTTSYLHNALGQRVRKSNTTMTVHFVYDESGHLLGEYDASGVLVQETIWMGDIPVATLRPNGSGVDLFYVHTDHLNTPRRISRPSDNAVLWRWDSDPFGSAAANEDPDGDTATFEHNSRFPGQYFDAESGLSYNYFRDYDPVVGRYVQSDPIGLLGGINTYAYAEQRPTMLTDSRGLTPAAAGLCFIPGVGWVGCGVAAVGAGAICFITGACQAAIQGIGDAIQQMCADDDEEEIDCDEWLDILNAQWALISIQSPGPFENLGEKNAHNARVDLFCALCPDLCDQARRFTTVTIQ